jgi:hypothetical protein
MRSKLVAAFVLAVASLVAVPAFAKGDGNGHGKANFPMPAAEFKAKIDARTAKAKEHMEERAAKLPADQAKELRAKFDAGTAQINAEVAKVTADGTVTAEEAKQVREVAKSARPHGKGGHHGKGKAKGDGAKK